MARILIVDDEATLLSLLRRYLERSGHQVASCNAAAEALAIFEAAPDAVDLLITDLTLPGMNGEELIARMRAISPSLPAILSSGYAHEPQIPGVGFLQKPFLPAMLLERVQQALGK